MRKMLAMVGTGVLALGLVAGCSTEKRTVRTETETYVPQQQPRVIEEEHTTIQRSPGFGDEETTIRRHRSTESEDTEE